MIPNDETLMAYADGELPPGERAGVEAALAADPSLAARVERLRRQRLQLRQAYDDVLDEPVPPALLAALDAPAGAAAAAPREAARRAPRPAWPRWRSGLALAAALVLGIALGRGFLAPAPMFAASATGLQAAGPLRDALDRRLASETAAGPVRLPLSFRTGAGQYCRAFVLARQRQAGLACRDAGGWRINVLEDTAGGDDAQGLRMAGSTLPPALLQAIDARIAGESLDAQGERQARDARWR